MGEGKGRVSCCEPNRKGGVRGVGGENETCKKLNLLESGFNF